jgi:hypothetical protein
LHAVLFSIHKRKDVILGAFQYAFEDCEIRYNTTCVEVLGAIEDDLVTFRGNFEIAVARVDGSTNELCEYKLGSKCHIGFPRGSTYQVLLSEHFLDTLSLVFCTHHVGSSRPQ